MAGAYFTLKLTLTEVSPGQYRSRIEDSPIGASSGPGCDFELAEKQVKEWLLPLESGAARRQDLIQFGQALFNLAFRDQVRDKYGQCVAVARERGAQLRIALSILPARLIAVPWEYMHDGLSFLLKRGQSVVRVLDEVPGTAGDFGPVVRPLVAVANPNDQDPFDAQEHLRKLTEALGPGCRPDVRMPADAHAIRQALLGNTYDAFYFVGHGRFTEALEGQLVVEGPHGESQYLDADRLAECIREGKIRFAYLNACSGARTSRGNPFAGVAQRLMRDGEVSCVVAMQAPVAHQAALTIAEEFFRDLQKGHSPEAALARARGASEDFSTWGLPVVYTYLSQSPSGGRGLLSRANVGCIAALFLLGGTVLIFPRLGAGPNKPQVPVPGTGSSNSSRPEEPNVLAGTVIDAVTREPLPGVTVTIQNLDDRDGQTPTTQTDDAGRFRFRNLPPGPKRQVRIHASKSGYQLSRTDPWLGSESHNVALQSMAP